MMKVLKTFKNSVTLRDYTYRCSFFVSCTFCTLGTSQVYHVQLSEELHVTLPIKKSNFPVDLNSEETVGTGRRFIHFSFSDNALLLCFLHENKDIFRSLNFSFREVPLREYLQNPCNT